MKNKAKKLVEFLLLMLVVFIISLGICLLFDSKHAIPYVEASCAIGSLIFAVVNSITDNKKILISSGIGIISVVFVGLFLVNIFDDHNASSSSRVSSKIVRSSSKITQSSSQAQVSSQAGNNNAKVVINGGQDVELNDNNFNGTGQAVQTNSTKNVRFNGNNFNQ